MIDLNTLLDLPGSAVYAVLDEDTRLVLVTASTSVLASLVRLAEKIKLGEEPYSRFQNKRLKFVVLESEDCRNRLLIRVGFHMQEFKSQGYELLIEKPPVEYRVKQFIRYEGGTPARAFLQAVLVSKRNKKILVGEFDSQEKYDEFVRLNYSNGSVYDIVCDVSVIGKSE